MRAGGKTLTLLGAPRVFRILSSLADGAMGQRDLRRAAGFPAQSTLRGHLKRLEQDGIAERRRLDSFPGTLEYELTEAGQELLQVTASLERWLAAAPAEPIELGSDAAKAAIKGLVDGWSVTVLTTLAEGPLSLTELDKRIASVSYPTIERCLEAMRLAEQLHVGPRGHGGTPYTITDWLRRGVGSLVAGARWEHRNRIDGANPPDQDDADGAFRVIAPLIDLPPRLRGVSQLVATVVDGNEKSRLMAFFEAGHGRAAFGSVYSAREPDAWASGSLEAWFSALLDGDCDGLDLSGDEQLVEGLLDGLHEALLGGETVAV
jgi:DNA-binding HxlR family transcriptional regulator